ITAPIEEPLLRMPSRYCSKNAALSLSGQKNGLRAISSQSHFASSILWGARRNTRRGLARRRTAAAAIIAQAVFGFIGEVGVAGAKLVLDLRIVLGALIGVLDQKRDRRSRRDLHA